MDCVKKGFLMNTSESFQEKVILLERTRVCLNITDEQFEYYFSETDSQISKDPTDVAIHRRLSNLGIITTLFKDQNGYENWRENLLTLRKNESLVRKYLEIMNLLNQFIRISNGNNIAFSEDMSRSHIIEVVNALSDLIQTHQGVYEINHFVEKAQSFIDNKSDITWIQFETRETSSVSHSQSFFKKEKSTVEDKVSLKSNTPQNQ